MFLRIIIYVTSSMFIGVENAPRRTAPIQTNPAMESYSSHPSFQSNVQPRQPAPKMFNFQPEITSAYQLKSMEANQLRESETTPQAYQSYNRPSYSITSATVHDGQPQVLTRNQTNPYSQKTNQRMESMSTDTPQTFQSYKPSFTRSGIIDRGPQMSTDQQTNSYPRGMSYTDDIRVIQVQQADMVKETENLRIENKENITPQKRNLKRPSTDSVASLDESSAKRFAGRQTRIFTGTIVKVLQWHKTMPANVFALFEVFAPCLSIRSGTGPQQKHLLLRDERGPVLQVTYYENEIVLNGSIQNGTMLRCVGRMVSKNRLVAMKISVADDDMLIHLQRLTYKSEHAINRLNT